MKISKLSYLWGFLALGLVSFLLYKSLFGEQGLWEISRLNKFYGQLVNKIVNQQEENKELQDEIEQLEQLPFQVEKAAREELGLVRPGDMVYKFKQKDFEK